MKSCHERNWISTPSEFKSIFIFLDQELCRVSFNGQREICVFLVAVEALFSEHRKWWPKNQLTNNDEFYIYILSYICRKHPLIGQNNIFLQLQRGGFQSARKRPPLQKPTVFPFGFVVQLRKKVLKFTVTTVDIHQHNDRNNDNFLHDIGNNAATRKDT